ncbi:hypothetical protein EQG41_19135 [Billgrantia azerbaijanica]|nr:hypothetical protein EQG41_19135 [Halomonas azerbaijanica]
MIAKRLLLAAAIVIALVAGYIGFAAYRTEAAISDFEEAVEAIGRRAPARAHAGEAFAELPAPVREYFAFTFRDRIPSYAVVRLRMTGDFRRPGRDTFAETTASQTIAVGEPALLFAATTPVLPGVWARAYDFYATGEMAMKAKILSAITVVDEQATPALNETSLRRWLLESPLYPMALLPGGPVRWEPVDAHRARAIVEAEGVTASLIATFRKDGSLKQFDAEEDGDLTTPYHGSGEHALRTEYREVAGMMIPHGFLVARAAEGNTHPFWRGEVTSIAFERAQAQREH